MQIRLEGTGTCRLKNLRVQVGENYIQISVDNFVVYSESFGPDQGATLEDVWLRALGKLRAYGDEHPN